MRYPGLHRLARRLAALSIVCALPAVAAAAPAPPAPPPAPAGGPPAAPDVTLYDMGGKAFPLSSLFGKVIVLDFWASWCAPCRKSFPFLDSLETKYGTKDVEVVGVTLEENDDAIAAFLRQVPVAFRIARDTSQKAGDAYHVTAMPTTFLIDRKGRIAARFEGGDASVHKKIASAVDTLVYGGQLPRGTGVRVAGSLEAKGTFKAWDRGYLADPIMNLDGDTLTRVNDEHIHDSKEAASGDGGAAGGGCGCN